MLPPKTLWLACIAVLFATRAQGQSAVHEYRPELTLTTPRVEGVALQFVVEQHLETATLAPDERQLGVALTGPTWSGLRPAFEVRYIEAPTSYEHRYIPQLYSALPLIAGLELRSRTRAEFRNIDGARSHRYQDRSALGRDVEIAGHGVFPYIQGDLSYDSRFSVWNRTERYAGARITMTSATSIDFFYMRQDDTRRSVKTTYGTGAILRVQL